MMLYQKYPEAWDTKNIKALTSLCHPDFEPTILIDVTSDMIVANDETFGPLAPLF